MPASTRTTNKETDFKVYYSKKIPKQKYFPHRKKTVREKTSARQDAPEKRQMEFLPEKMRRRRSRVEDSEEEEESDKENQDGVKTQSEIPSPRVKTRKTKKRPSDAFEDEEEDGEPIRPTPKRRRRSSGVAKKRTPLSGLEPASRNRRDSNGAAASTIESEQEQDITRRRRRQSTMTQLVHGRRPQSGDDEPEFQPVKRTLRRSWSGGKGQKGQQKDRQQKTLTQMVPGLGSFRQVSDEDTEEEPEEVEDATTYNNALAEHFASRGVSQSFTGGDEAGVAEDEDPIIPHHSNPPAIVQPAEEFMDNDSEDAYEPTQDVLAPKSRAKRNLRRSSRKVDVDASAITPPTSTPHRPRSARFGLLSTPEKRRIHEIASSQSPPDMPLSTQTTPATNRFASQAQSRITQAVQDTPSRRKRVAFLVSTENVDSVPSSKRKFTGIIQDSEDEDEDVDEDQDEDENLIDEAQDEEFDIGQETQALIRDIDNPPPSRNIGAETQAMIQQIDNACINTIDNDEVDDRGLAKLDNQEACDFDTRSSQGVVQFSRSQVGGELDLEQDRTSSDHSGHPHIEHEPNSEAVSSSPLPLDPIPQASTHTSTDVLRASRSHRLGSPVAVKNEVVEVTQMSSPMVIKDESEDEEVDVPTPPHRTTLPPDSTHGESGDLDGHPIQIPRSPTPVGPKTQATTCSHTSEAEQQLRSEWLSYSQYPRKPPTSSMHVAQNGSSYQANPFSDPVARQLAPPRWSAPLSQATTVDCTQRSPNVTPKKQRNASAHTTPQKVPNSQPFVSPRRPPSLVIPSSFPSPTSRSNWGNLSSPVLGSTQDAGFGSIEDFTIPPLPPGSSPLFPADEDIEG
jgi:hypothetical protein